MKCDSVGYCDCSCPGCDPGGDKEWIRLHIKHCGNHESYCHVRCTDR